ncbi:hypothetical protein FA258_21700 [Pseudomonas aeruginosa]|nr:hypothetical protein [Pseudomonas aeruginosa]MBG7023702.1 hypothetical protein [Pseudomonas aeruginosa]MBG7370060.1 hypothetical protein [Pseudomonas aeruginosa]MCO2980009.1 hypothetical protein [Pseudomonas aeruginosa]
MNDRELLELAARAAGMNIQRSRLDDPLHRDFLMNGEGVRNLGQCSFPWNPLDDDGDALRLAVKLKLEIERSKYSDDRVYVGPPDTAPWREEADSEQDIYQATRRAIVRAAAEIGKSMGGGE